MVDVHHVSRCHARHGSHHGGMNPDEGKNLLDPDARALGQLVVFGRGQHAQTDLGKLEYERQ